MTQDTRIYEKEYNEEAFLTKIGRNFKRIGGKIILPALELYLVMKKGNISTVQKLVIIAALGYFISPADAIPDIAPLVGYTDDLAVLMATTYRIFKEMSEQERGEIRAMATNRMRKLFGE